MFHVAVSHFFQLSMSHVIELKVSETNTWLERVDLV